MLTNKLKAVDSRPFFSGDWQKSLKLDWRPAGSKEIESDRTFLSLVNTPFASTKRYLLLLLNYPPYPGISLSIPQSITVPGNTFVKKILTLHSFQDN